MCEAPFRPFRQNVPVPLSAEALRRAAAGQPVAESERAALAEGLLADAAQTRLFGVTAANVAEVVDGRLARLVPACAALRAEPLDVAGLPEHVVCSPRDLFRFHLPLADLIARRAAAAESRCLVAIAAVPAGGKSVFTAILARILASFQLPFGLVSVGLDGYHYLSADAPVGLSVVGVDYAQSYGYLGGVGVKYINPDPEIVIE